MEDRRYVLALGEDADKVANALGVSVLRRVRNVVVVETGSSQAIRFAHEGEYVHVYRSSTEALRALSVFER
ncbi:MAG: hypothetical protein ACXWXQ_00920 [Actinomycetota bacterium]